MANVIPILTEFPTRIVSLVPSQTELLSYFELDQEVVGITKFCIHPEKWFREKTRIGGTKNFHIERIHQLQPDLIIANKEENTKDQIEELQASYPVYISDINSIDDALRMISELGLLLNKKQIASDLIRNINQARSEVAYTTPLLKTMYFIWHNPWMVAGSDSFISDMMLAGGFENCIQSERYPVLSAQELKAYNPQVILLSSEPFPFSVKHANEIKSICPDATIKIVDGELFSWYGSRMCQSFEYFRALNEELLSI